MSNKIDPLDVPQVRYKPGHWQLVMSTGIPFSIDELNREYLNSIFQSLNESEGEVKERISHPVFSDCP